MSSISALRKYVEPEAPGCPAPTIDRALRKAARDLCEKTYCWKEARSDVTLTSGISTYTTAVFAGAELVGIEYVEFNSTGIPGQGLELLQTTERELSMGLSTWRITTGDPTHFFTVTKTVAFRLFPIPNRTIANGLSYEVYLKPALESDDLPEFLTRQYAEVLQNGALAEILKMSKTPWSDPGMAADYRQQYRNGVYAVRDRVDRMQATQNLNITTTLVA